MSYDEQTIKKEIERLFSPKNIFYSGQVSFLESCKCLYANPNVKKLTSDEQVVETVNLFLVNNLNLTLTSKAGYMHRNTLIYRLEKVNNLVGLDVKNFYDAVLFVNFLMFYNNFKEELNK